MFKANDSESDLSSSDLDEDAEEDECMMMEDEALENCAY